MREGTGVSFFYYAPTTSLVAIPTASNEVPFISEETTVDFQRVTIQGQITYRLAAREVSRLEMHLIISTLGDHHRPNPAAAG